VLNCREVTRLASAKQERSLTLTEAMGFHFHTFMCKGCRNFDTQMGDLRKLMKADLCNRFGLPTVLIFRRV